MKVAVSESLIEGRGLFATGIFEAGEPIFASTDQSNSEVHAAEEIEMDDEEFAAFVATHEKINARAIGEGRHLVTLTDNIVNYGNHSCDPNMWLNADRTTLVARRRIEVGEELTSDYAFWTDSDTWSMECNCGAAICRGTVRGKDWQLPELQVAYQGHWPVFLEEAIDALGG